MSQTGTLQHFARVHAPRLFRYFAGRFDHATSADLVQETLMRLHQKITLDVYNPAQGDLVRYAFGIAKFVALEAAKEKRHDFILEPLGPKDDIKDTHVPAQASGDSASTLRNAIAMLTGQEQEVVLLLIDQDLTLQEIASILDVPLNTVKSHMHRAKQRLKVIFTSQNLSMEDFI